jgi:hypothetical protein
MAVVLSVSTRTCFVPARVTAAATIDSHSAVRSTSDTRRTYAPYFAMPSSVSRLLSYARVFLTPIGRRPPEHSYWIVTAGRTRRRRTRPSCSGAPVRTDARGGVGRSHGERPGPGPVPSDQERSGPLGRRGPISVKSAAVTGARRTNQAAAFTEGGGAARTDATSGSRSERGKRRSNVPLRVEVALRRGGNRPLAELAADLVDGDERVGALVRVDSNDLTMGPTSLISVLGVVRPAGELAVLEVDQGVLSSHPGRSYAPGERRIEDKPRRQRAVSAAGANVGLPHPLPHRRLGQVKVPGHLPDRTVAAAARPRRSPT